MSVPGLEIADHIGRGHVEVRKIAEQRRVVGAAGRVSKLAQAERRRRQSLAGRERG